jgi:hypothetical protein
MGATNTIFQKRPVTLNIAYMAIAVGIFASAMLNSFVTIAFTI